MQTRQQVERLLDDVLRIGTELDNAECKSGLGDAFQEAMCAMANRRDRDGGVVFLGVDDRLAVSGVPDLEASQKKVTDWASDVFNVPLRVAPEVLERDGSVMLAVIVPACPAGHRPCHFRRHGPYDGSWVRVGNFSRRMTRDEVRREITADELARGTVSSFDMTPYLTAGLHELDESLVQGYVSRMTQIRPSSAVRDLQYRDLLVSVSTAAEYEGKLYPTPAGLLFFGHDPQRFLPQSSVEFLHLWGPDLTSTGPDGSRWRSNDEFTGTIPHIIDQVEAAVLDRAATRGIVDGFRRRDEPEYPREALREAIVNAVAHRDYTMRGSRVQIRLYPDRLEIHTPGGLPAPVTVDNIEEEQATRNEALVALLQDYGYMERRGFGLNAIVASMREAGLAPPLMTDNGASFNLCLKRDVLMSPETLRWLRRFEGADVSPQQRLALAYLRGNERLYNRDYARLNGCSSVEATQSLRQMVERSLVRMQSTRGGAYYVLADRLPKPAGPKARSVAIEERILDLAREAERLTAGLCRERLGLESKQAYRVLKRLVDRGSLVSHGERRGRFYSLAEQEGGDSRP